MSQEINVTSTSQRIVVDMPTRTVSIVLGGPVGPAGPPGEVSLATFNAAIAALDARITALESA